jgi:transposase
VIVIGADSHKRTHTMVAVDQVGRRLRVPTRLMAATRRGARHPGKSDPIDAEAVALAALRHPDLPVAELDGPTREVKLLVDDRRDLVRQRTRVANRLRWHLHELDPALQIPHGACAAPR